MNAEEQTSATSNASKRHSPEPDRATKTKEARTASADEEDDEDDKMSHGEAEVELARELAAKCGTGDEGGPKSKPERKKALQVLKKEVAAIRAAQEQQQRQMAILASQARAREEMEIQSQIIIRPRDPKVGGGKFHSMINAGLKKEIKGLKSFCRLSTTSVSLVVQLNDPECMKEAMEHIKKHLGDGLKQDRVTALSTRFLENLSKSMYGLIKRRLTQVYPEMSMAKVSTSQFQNPLQPNWSMSWNDRAGRGYREDIPSSMILSLSTHIENGQAKHMIEVASDIEVNHGEKLKLAAVIEEFRNRIDNHRAQEGSAQDFAPPITVVETSDRSKLINYFRAGKGKGKGKGT